MRQAFTSSPLLLALALLAIAAAVSCSVDYAGILDGKACDSSGACADGFTCDRQTMSCIPEGQGHPDAAGGGGTDAGGTKDTGHPHTSDAGGRDTGRDDAGTGGDTGTVDDTGVPDDTGTADAGHDDIGPVDTGSDDTGHTDIGPVDTGDDDTGHDDAGTGDSGAQDAGTPDTGPADAGFDAGTTVCKGGELRCTSDTALEQCTPDGSGWAPKETCQTYCLTDHCVDCKPGVKRCADDSNLETCATDGTAYEWSRFCTGYCLTDRCVDCRPGDAWCDANGDLAICQPGGIDIMVTQCPSGCDDVNLRCYLCVPDDQWCDGNVAKRCHGDGMAFDQQDCCIANTCESGQCIDTSPHIGNAAPLDGNVYTDVTITIDGCQFAADAVVEFWIGSSWSQPGNGSITGRTSTTRIVYKLTNIQPPRNKDYPMRVRNPGGGTSNQINFHVNN